MEPALMSWSGGKDSALALYRVMHGMDVKPVALLTTLTRDFDRISMHGVRRGLLELQAAAIGLPLDLVWIEKGTSNQEYEEQMRSALERRRREGIRRVIFGDLFLEDVRRYREERLAQIGMEGLFPLWGKPTADLAASFIGEGFKAILCCVDPKALGKEFCGRRFDRALIRDLPPEVDPCGENGEFHTFVYDGPIFHHGLELKVGETVLRDGFYFTDLAAVGFG